MSDQPKYLKKLIDGGWIPQPGELLEVMVLHDDDCSFWKDRICNCDPEVELVERTGREVEKGANDVQESD